MFLQEPYLLRLTPCSVVTVHFDFSGKYGHYLLGLLIRCSSTLKMEAVLFSETTVNIYQTTRCHVPEGSHR
jgi:hypothetical protein